MFLFRGDDVFKSVALLSGGEKARLSLLTVFLEHPNFLILDEPTNHLDIPTREIIEEAVRAFAGTCLIVSHDRYFLDKTVGRILEMNHGVLTEYLGNYTYYKEKKQDLVEFEKDRRGAAPEKAETPKKETPAKPEVSQSKIAKIEQIEMEIAREEATLKMYEMQMAAVAADPEAYKDAAAAYGTQKEKLDGLYVKWENAQ